MPALAGSRPPLALICNVEIDVHQFHHKEFQICVGSHIEVLEALVVEIFSHLSYTFFVVRIILLDMFLESNSYLCTKIISF